MRSGHVNLLGISGGTFRNAGQWGFTWSSQASSTDTAGNSTPSAYSLYFITLVSPSGGPFTRHYGFPLRCLSTVLDM